MLKKVEQVPTEIIIEGNTVLKLHDRHASNGGNSQRKADTKMSMDKVKMDVVFQQTQMPEQRVNYIKPKRHDFL